MWPFLSRFYPNLHEFNGSVQAHVEMKHMDSYQLLRIETDKRGAQFNIFWGHSDVFS